MRPLISQDTRRLLREHDGKWYIKAIIQALCILFAFVALILFADATALNNKYYPAPYGGWTDWMPLFPVLISFIYNPLTLFLLIFRRFGRPLHPGWDVGTRLVIWALGVAAIVLSVGWGWFQWWQPVIIRFVDGTVPCRGFRGAINAFSKPCEPMIYTIGKIEAAANVFLGFIIILEFTLFVLACIATYKPRRNARRTQSQTNNIRMQYNRDPEDHAAHEPPAYAPHPPSTTAVNSSDGATKYS